MCHYTPWSLTFLWKSIENLLIDTFLRKAWKFLNNFTKGTWKVFNGRMKKWHLHANFWSAQIVKQMIFLKKLRVPCWIYQTPDNNTKCFINKFCLCSYRLQLFWPCISYTDTVFHLIHVKVNNQTGKPLPLSNIMWI